MRVLDTAVAKYDDLQDLYCQETPSHTISIKRIMVLKRDAAHVASPA